MSLLMVAPMGILMIMTMRKMYPNKKFNIGIISVATITFIVALIFLRNQTFISDIQYMKAMIPHHSSAIMTSENEQFTDPELKELSKNIIQAQKKEIAQMKKIIERIK